MLLYNDFKLLSNISKNDSYFNENECLAKSHLSNILTFAIITYLFILYTIICVCRILVYIYGGFSRIDTIKYYVYVY